MMAREKDIGQLDIKLKEIKHVYFIGIGGIGMSALARYFNLIGKQVSGYDKVKSTITSKLESEGINIHFTDEIQLINSELLESQPHEVLVIYTPAIPSDHSELNYLKSTNFSVIKRSKALGLVTSNSKGLAVAGTHGKTTTSSILAHIIYTSEEPVSAFLGGIATNFQSNFVFSKNSKFTVVEADEYDRSFLTLSPFGAIITSTDADHLDIYEEPDALIKSFKDFSSQVSDVIVLNEKVTQHFTGIKNFKTYGWAEDCDYQISNRKIESGQCRFDLKTPSGELNSIAFPMSGLHNTENAAGALALALESGINPKKAAQSLSSFRGIKRRFEVILSTSKHVYIDDYAHHPTELSAAIKSAQELYPEKKITGIFQPHLYSRTRDFMDDFAQSLSLLDQIVLLDIYPARELPITGITSQSLLQKIDTEKHHFSKEETIKWIDENRPEVLMTLGAGDIDSLVEPIKNILS